MIQKIILLSSVLILCSCSVSKRKAPIEFNHNSRYSSYKNTNGDDSSYQSEIITPTSSTSDESNDGSIVLPDKIEDSKKYIYHEVKVGETIEDIAQNYNQSITDIAKLNDLLPPYYVDEFQIIKLYKNAPQTQTTTTESTLTKKTPKKEKEFIKPVSGAIISKFGDKTALGYNKGINIEANSGDEIVASTSGKVVYSSYDATYGNLVIIKSNNSDTFTSYAHMMSSELAKGDQVNKGEIIGYVGSSGKVDKPQLHFGIREGKNAKDPMKYLE